MNTGVLSTSRKKNEQRRPIHPAHLLAIPAELRRKLIFEKGYGIPFGVSDEEIAALTGGVGEREQLLRDSELVILAKPVAEDAAAMKPGSILWGWVHCVQGEAITQATIDRGLTLVPWEMMNHWDGNGSFQSHIFQENNQIAGYAAVLHALTLKGFDGFYGEKKRVVLINTGQVSRGALRGLKAFGFADIAVVIPQSAPQVPPDFEGCEIHALSSDHPAGLEVQAAGGEKMPLIELLAEADLIVNGIFQNPLKPYLFVRPGEEKSLKKNTLIIDVSCDTGMGFHFSRATSFDEPLLRIGVLDYYAVDHTPSFLWNSATWQISKALLPYLPPMLAGADTWKNHPVLDRAVDILNGEILNKDILTFQKREKTYPYLIARTV